MQELNQPGSQSGFLLLKEKKIFFRSVGNTRYFLFISTYCTKTHVTEKQSPALVLR